MMDRGGAVSGNSRPAGRGIFLLIRRLKDAREGAGAVEFAIVAPLLIMIYIGAFEVSVAMTVSRKVSRASSTISDLLTQRTDVTKATLDGMNDVAASIMAPFSTGSYTMKITGISVDADGKATVAWSRDQAAGTPYAKNSTVALPDDLTDTPTFIVRTEFVVPHEILLMMPGLKGSSVNELDLAKTSYFRQRIGTSIPCGDC